MRERTCELREVCHDGSIARAFIQEVADAAAGKAVAEHWRALGVDIHDPDDLREIQLDWAFLRSQRLGVARMKGWIGRSLVVTALMGLIMLLVLGLQQWGRGLFQPPG